MLSIEHSDHPFGVNGCFVRGNLHVSYVYATRGRFYCSEPDRLDLFYQSIHQHPEPMDLNDSIDVVPGDQKKRYLDAAPGCENAFGSQGISLREVVSKCALEGGQAPQRALPICLALDYLFIILDTPKRENSPHGAEYRSNGIRDRLPIDYQYGESSKSCPKCGDDEERNVGLQWISPPRREDLSEALTVIASAREIDLRAGR